MISPALIRLVPSLHHPLILCPTLHHPFCLVHAQVLHLPNVLPVTLYCYGSLQFRLTTGRFLHQ